MNKADIHNNIATNAPNASTGGLPHHSQPQHNQPLRSLSLRRYLLVGILIPVLLFIALDTWVLYRQTLAGVNLAYDRTLLASAKTIGEQLEVEGQGAQAKVVSRVPYSALEAFEADNRSRMFYRVTGFQGEKVSGFDNIAPWSGRIPVQPPYSALVDFYDDKVTSDVKAAGAGSGLGTGLSAGLETQAVRVAVLLQPVVGVQANGMAVVQVAETLELRESLAREMLVSTLWRQSVLVLVIAGVVVWVVQRAVKPVRDLSREISARPENDLSPLHAERAPRELQPLVQANNQLMLRLDHLLQHQKRFVRDTAHQLRTPLAVLKIQTQSALRGDTEPLQALKEISTTVESATNLANQMLSLAKVEQLRQQADAPITDWAVVLRELALELAPLIADKDIDFSIDTQAACVRAHDWMLRELSRNLLHNAIKYTPVAGVLAVRLLCDSTAAELVVQDSGPGIDDALRLRLFQPFSAGAVHSGAAHLAQAANSGAVHTGAVHTGAGLGLAIAAEIVQALDGKISLDNRLEKNHVVGLNAQVRLPLSS